MDFDGARTAVAAHLREVFDADPVQPAVRRFGWETPDAWYPEIDWKGVLGVHIFKVDKISGHVIPLGFGEFLDVSSLVQVGPWPASRRAGAKGLGSASMDADTSALTAAAGAISGAMLALVPSAADAARLAVEGGEAAAELHCTVLYLGDDASLIDGDARQALISWASDYAALWPSVDCEAFAPAFFNPDGEEPCLTLVCSGGDLAEFHDTAEADISEIVDLPDQHAPYIPHVTLSYLGASDGPAPGAEMQSQLMVKVIERVGPITFDRIRLAFAGNVTDIELGSGDVTVLDPTSIEAIGQPEPVAEPAPEPVVAAAAPLRERVDAPTRPERQRLDACPYCDQPGVSHAAGTCRSL